MRRMIIAVRRACEAGNMVIFGADMKAIRKLAAKDRVDENIIVNNKTAKTTPMEYKDGLYKYPTWVKRRIRKHTINGDDMEVGNCENDSDVECGECDTGYNGSLWAPFVGLVDL